MTIVKDEELNNSFNDMAGNYVVDDGEDDDEDDIIEERDVYSRILGIIQVDFFVHAERDYTQLNNPQIRPFYDYVNYLQHLDNIKNHREVFLY